MVCKTYEIIETIPSVLKTNIPLIDVFSYSIYFISSFFYLLYKGIKDINYIKAFFSNKRKVSFEGAENKTASIFDLNGFKKEFKKDGIIKTEIIYYEKKEALVLLNDLIRKGYKIDLDKLSSSLIIKEKKEFYADNIEKKEEVLISTPFLAEKISKILFLDKLKF